MAVKIESFGFPGNDTWGFVDGVTVDKYTLKSTKKIRFTHLFQGRVCLGWGNR